MRRCAASELVKELLAAKQADGASGRYLSDLKHRLNRFLTASTANSWRRSRAQIDDWLRGLAVAPVTRNNFRRVLIVALNFAKGRGYCLTNPADTTAKAKVVDAPVRILTVKETTPLFGESWSDNGLRLLH